MYWRSLRGPWQSSRAQRFSVSQISATGASGIVPSTPFSFFSASPTACTSRNVRVCSCPAWSTTAPWNYSLQPRLLRHWKYCTVSAPWATAWRLDSRCMPGFFSLQTSCQFTCEGVDSISANGLCFRQRIRS